MSPINLKTRKRIIIASLVLIVPGLIVLGLHLWFVNNARTVLKQYITEQSKGKIKLDLSELNLNLLSKRLLIREADLLSTDSLHQPITYHVKFRTLSLKVNSLWALLFEKRLLLDSIKLHDPVLEIMQWRKDTAEVVLKDELSIPQEMGKVYKSMLEALDEFGIRRIVISNARFSLINKMKKGVAPVTVSNINFDLARSELEAKNRESYVANKETLELKTTGQNISLPGGRHRISFKSFNLQLFRQLIVLDSCTVTAIANDSSKSNYKIFFKRLSLVGVDFNAMSTQNIIKADSVYCENPFFDLNLFKSDAVKKKTELPDPNKILRELAGNLSLAFVGVDKAGIHIDINGKTKQSFFNSNKDNFEIRGLRLNPDSSEAITIKKFDMVLRDYHLYNEDSSSAYTFDSLHFSNRKIALNNFSLVTTIGRRRRNNPLNIKIPYFELTDLNWYEAIFEQNLVAREALLNNPIIHFTRKTKAAGTTGRQVDLFESLNSIDSLVTLEKVTVNNGQLNLQLGSSTSLNFQNIDFSLSTNKALGSTTNAGLRRAVDRLAFSRGLLKLPDLTAQLSNASYSANNIIEAEKVLIAGIDNSMLATVNNVQINNMLFGEETETIVADGMRWSSAFITLQSLPSANNSAKNKRKSSIHLKNIDGNNTQLKFFNGPNAFSTFIHRLDVASLKKEANMPVEVEGFNLEGNNLLVKSENLNVSATTYKVTEDAPSYLTSLQVEQNNGRDSINIKSSNIKFSLDLNKLLANKLHLLNLEATAPVIKISKWDTTTVSDTSVQQSAIRIDQIIATEPDINIFTHRNDSVGILSIPKSENSSVKASGIFISKEGMQIGTVSVNTTAATFVKATGQKLGIEKGRIDMELSDINFGKKNGKMNWSAFINNLSVQNAQGLQLGKTKNNLLFQEASVGNLSLSSSYLPNFSELMKANVSAWLRIPEGQYVDSNTTFQWYNANYNNSSRTLHLDSLVYFPTMPLDSVLAHAPYQLDYITAKTGAVTIVGFDAGRYEKDSSFIANTMTIADPVLTIYRDKQPPSSPIKKYKPLPVDMIKNISLPVSLEGLQMKNGTITYTERNGQSRKEGALLISEVNGELSNIKNSNFNADDSLSLNLSGRLMDSAYVDISFKESYKDTLSGFLLKAQIKPASISVFNPMIVPLLNVKIASGVLDSASFVAVGRDDLALGEMNMHYRNLRIRLVKDGDPNKSTFLQKVISIVANTFVIKKNNTSRTGVIFFKRNKNSSFTNYIVKMTVSGLASSAGVKKNSKYLKQYKKELKESGLPPINSKVGE